MASKPAQQANVPDPPSGLRRALFSVLLVVFAWLVIESLFAAAWWFRTGESFSPDAARSLRQQAGAEPTPPGEVTAPEFDAKLQPWLRWNVLHPYVGYVFDRNALPEGEISEFGYRGSDSPIQRRAENRLIVAITGGSLANQFSSDGAPHLVGALERDPSYAGREIRIVRLAVNGYKQPQQLMTLAYLLTLGAEFDIVINIDGFNEVALHEAENAHQDVFPVFPRSWASRVEGITQASAQLDSGELRWLARERARWAAIFDAFPVSFLPTLQLAWKTRDDWLTRDIAAVSERVRTRRLASASYAVTGPRSELSDRAELYAQLADIWRRSSLQLERLARANDIAYFHFLQPNQYVPPSKPMAEQERAIAIRANQPYRPGIDAGYPLLVRAGAALRSAGVRFTDLTGVFEDVEEMIYRDGCCHVNSRGNEILAEAIARAILGDRDATASDAPRTPPATGASDGPR